MSYIARLQERERAKSKSEAPITALTKPTEPGFVSSGSNAPVGLKLHTASRNAWQLDPHPVYDLPLEQARLEFDAWCARLGLTRNLGASPEALRRELPNLRGLSSRSESGTRRP